MASYYYLVASLPELFLDEEPPIAAAEFRAACAQWLDADDARDIHGLLDDRWEAVVGGAARQWLARETEIRNALVRLRAVKARVEAEPFLRPLSGVELHIERGVAEAMNRPQPLERELGLDQLRWSLLDDLARFDPFGLPAVIAYALKIKMVERWHALTVEKGQAAVAGYLKQQLAGLTL